MVGVYRSPLFKALYKFLKWWLHVFSNECELQRLCKRDGEQDLTQDTIARVGK